MKLNRKYITPFISLIFLVIGSTGLFMYFHLFDGYTEVVHEYLGLSFVVFAILHITLNWKALQTHFKKNIFLPAAITVSLISIGFIVAETIFVPIDIILIDKLVQAPIIDSFKILEIDYSEASVALEKNGLFIEGSNSLEEIWINNESSPQQVIEIIFNKL